MNIIKPILSSVLVGAITYSVFAVSPYMGAAFVGVIVFFVVFS